MVPISVELCFLSVLVLLSIGQCQDVTVEFFDTQVEVNEGDHFNVRIAKQGVVDKPVLVVVRVPNDIDGDFVGTSQVARYESRASGVASVTFTVADDTEAENDEVFYMRLEPLDPTVRVGGRNRLRVIIRASDDAYGVFRIDEISPVIVTEKLFTSVTKLKVKREVSTFDRIIVNFMVNSSEADALPGQDILPVTGSVVFQAQQAEAEISLQIRFDDIPERDESFYVTLTSATNNARVLGPMTEVIIKANDAAVRFSSSQYRFEEGPNSKTVRVEVTRGLDSDGQPSSFGVVDGEVTVRYVFETDAAGMATSPEDFTGTEGTLTFLPGERGKTIEFLIVDDAVPEIEESFRIRLFNLLGDAVFVTPSVTTVTINANDNPSGIISFPSSPEAEGPLQQIDEDTFSSVTFQVQRYEGTFGEVTVQWMLTRDFGASVPVNEDVGPTQGTLRFADGQNEASITLTVVQDNTPESSEMFLVNLLPNSVTGDAKVEGVMQARLLVEDSDNVYGTVEFGPGTDHALITTASKRTLRMSVTRSGGRADNLVANISVQYDDAYQHRQEGGILVTSQASAVLPEGQDPILVDFDLQGTAFLSIGGVFTATIESVEVQEPPRFGAYNSPTIGFRQQISVVVSEAQANGETGFFNVTDQTVEEPDSGVTLVGLLVSREGLIGRAVVRWSLSGNDVTAEDVQEMSGSVVLEPGMSEVILTIGILADDTPELTESIVVSLDSIEPSSTQRLRPGSTSITIDVLSNDNPGGVIQFSSRMLSSFEVEEGGSAIQVIVERTGGDLEERRVRYSISPAGDEQFYGATNIITFEPGRREATASIVAIPDGVPELPARFTLTLTPMGSPPSVLGENISVPIVVLGSNNPYGVIQFYTDPTIVYTGEGQADQQLNVTIRVQRDWGTNGQVTVPWTLSPTDQQDLTPTEGILVFEEGQNEGTISLLIVNDDIPEGDEQFVLQLSAPEGGAQPGIPMVARIIIRENDNPVEFTEPVLYASEPQNLVLTIERQGRLDRAAHVHYRTLDGSASHLEGDYVHIPTQELVFAPGQREQTIQVSVLDDDVPEGNETFSVQLLDVGGDLIVTGASTATILILTNDDAFGVFSFGEPLDQEVEEGSTVFYSIVRARGNVGSVRVYWELQDTSNSQILTPGEDFLANSGFTDFSPQENQQPLAITPLADRLPETAESFRLVLTRVEVTSGGSAEGGLVSLAATGLVATVRVLASDDPNGRMAFNAVSRELAVAEDFLPEQAASTRAVFTVERRQGTRNDVKVLWEIFSDKVGGDLPLVTDLLFIGQWPATMNDIINKRRPGTMTPVALFSGAPGQFVTVNPESVPALTNRNDGFSVLAWVQPFPGSDGYILAYTSTDAATDYLSLRLTTTDTAVSLTLRLSSTTQINQELTVDSSVKLDDGQWHHIAVALGNATVTFYLDGIVIGTRTTPDTAVAGGPGAWLVGAATPGTDLYTGYMQDVRIFTRALEASAVTELYLSAPFEDITPTSGTLEYAEGVRTQTFSVQSKQDIEEEGREVFAVILLGVTGGAALSLVDSRTTLSVLKSDNANGLFGFESQCVPERAVNETVSVTCAVSRERGDDGTVTVSWRVDQRVGQDLQEEATSDFDLTRGSVVFLPGIRSQTFQVQVRDDTTPELDEVFQITLTSAESDDGLVGSTDTSGASLDPGRRHSQLVVEENDHPYGLLQFSARLGEIPPPDVMIAPLSQATKITVSEEGGVIPLVVQRAQGTLGDVRAEWRTRDITALSEGKSPPDYVGAVGNIFMESGQNYALVNITVRDNSLPETEKTFSVELVNPTGGADLGPGAQAVVTIEASDGAFGIFQFSDASLNVQGEEGGDDGFNIIPLQVSRLAGVIGVASVSYEVDETAGDQSSTDVVNPSGIITFQAGEASAVLDLQIRGDTEPELDEILTVRLVQTVGGQLGDPLKRTATVTVLANDDPYGRFIVAAAFRPGRAEERDQDVRITVERLGGSAGTVEVDYVTLDPSETFPFLPGPVTRAGTDDYEPTQGTVSFGPGQVRGDLILHTLDDSFPEQDESVFVRLTRARLIQGEQLSPVPNSPRLGLDSETYAQLIISSNDDASGRLTLSPNVLTVSEAEPSVALYVQREGGSFGEVTVAFRVIEGSARINLDFVLLSRLVILASGETRKRVPLELIDDRVPELAETFTVELVEPVTGGAVLGAETTSLLTIEPSDDPNGVFSFVGQGQTVRELNTTYPVELTVARTGGSVGVVTVNWEATLNDQPASEDVSPASGFLYFVSNDATQKIVLSILPDNIPEGTEAINIRLTNATNGGRIASGSSSYTLTISPNDSPHGTVQLASDRFVVQERASDGAQTATVVRSGGVYGRLMVFYSTSVLSITDLVALSNGDILDLFENPFEGVPSLEGTEVDLTTSNDTLQTCSRTCLRQATCASFLHRVVDDSPVCLWYTTSVASNLLEYDRQAAYYSKDFDKVSEIAQGQARDGEDFSSLTRTWSYIEDGQTSAQLPLSVLDDAIPELEERFLLRLDSVRVADGSATSDNLDVPKLGQTREAIVVIATNDDAFGVFSIAKPAGSTAGSELLDSNVMEVLETDRLAVDLIVERQGGTLGVVSVEWSVSRENRTAVYGQDYIADGATLVFSAGQTRRVITLTILDDSLPEDNEELTVVLSNPRGGATISPDNAMRVIILASDFVAGRLSFEQTSALVNEGDEITAVVQRTFPGAGTVTANWVITGRGGLQAALGFTQTTGQLLFLPGELRKEINITVLVDDTPEVNEEYSMTLENIVTQGVESSGRAELDPQRGSLLITIAASNEPHGIFQLALPAAADIRVQENVGVATVRVDRKFGAIGTVRVSYNVAEGSLRPFGTQRSPASAGQDFAEVDSGHIDMRDGETSASISITIVDDAIPEIDEVLVLRLTNVALIDSTDKSQPPKLDNATATEIIIAANDGAQGIIEFAQDSQSVSVTEQGQAISLTVVRGGGTFGRVSVFFYSQPITESTVAGQDYNLTDAELVFEEGESRKSIGITILQDPDPEPEETFDVILASPSNGAALGQKTRASVTILANDNAGGVVAFDRADFIQMREATPNDQSGSKAEILLTRGPGAFGALSVPFTVTTSAGQFTGDVSPDTGSVEFADRQTTAVLVLETVNDDRPEVEETFTLTLQNPSGDDAILGDITSRTLVIAASDAPYGLMEIFTAGSRLSSFSVEEAFSSLEFDVVRSQGTLGEVTVDVMTVPGTATAATDVSSVVLAPMAQAPGASVVDWHHIATSPGASSKSTSFLVLLTSLPSNTQLAAMLSSDAGLGAGQSVLFKWQGQITPVRTFQTDGASAATSFLSGGSTYLVVTNAGREGSRQVSSFLYRLSATGEMEVVQGLPTSGASDVTSFVHGDKRFLFVTNSLDDSSRSDIASHVYSWEEAQGRFSSAPVQLVSTLYARGVASFSVDGKTFVAVANYFDRSSGSYEISSVIYRMESDFTLVQHQQLATRGAVSLVYTEAGNLQLLAVANNRQDVIATPQDSAVYRWDASAQAFVFHQALPTSRALKVTAVTTQAGAALLIFANSVGNSEIFVWDLERSQYRSAWTGGPFQALRPLTFDQPNGALDALGVAYLDRLQAPEIFQLAHIKAGSDFVPRRVTLTFEPGQSSLRTSVVTLTDDTPEDTESFSVTLVSPTGGAEIGPQAAVAVDILSNDDAHGVIEFNEDSLALTVEEAVDQDTTIQLNVLRRLGFFGRVVVAWQATGDHGGVGDITPLTGQVVFSSGQSVATISLTVRDDQEPEFDEVTYIRLTEIVEDGTSLDSKGAKLGANAVASVTVLANDSPYGVVSWAETELTVTEPEGTDKSVSVGITRRQGLERAIRINYVTSIAPALPESSQATPGQDFVATQANVVMAEGMSRVNVIIVIKQDSQPEADETFLVNLTSVSFQGSAAGSEAAPSIALNGGVMEVTITENDNARGFVELDVETNVEGRLDVYEEFGRDVTIELPIVRRVGFFGSLIVTWQADPVEADVLDFSPASGTVEFADQQREATIAITILDDAVPEDMETFDVKLIDVTGDAGLGQTTSVRIAILKNDSPTGLFRFATSQVETQEARTTSDPAGQATLVVQRVQGNQGLVNVRWRLNAEAEQDFMPPLEDTVQFSQGEVEKAIVLQTRPDTVLEGREEFIISLVSADNNADISSSDGDCTVVILPDGGASGTISVLADFRSVLVGEPGESSPGYPGEVEVKLTRGQGIFGEVVVTWSLTPRDLSAFVQVEGSLKFLDLQQTASIVLQTRDDSVPELRQTFTLQLNSASGGAVLSPLPGASSSQVTYVASDFPHGLVQFVLPEVILVSEDQNTVVVTVSRGKGLNGEIQVAYSTASGEAMENEDFLPSAGVLTFPAGVDSQTISIAILSDNLSEGPEDFYVNLTSVVIVGDSNDYTDVGGLSRDMAPALGPLHSKIVRIDKNDDAEGILQFSQATYTVKEESGVATVTVVRLRGDHGRVTARYATGMLTATDGADYVGAEGELVLEDGASQAEINVTLRDDALMEQLETFTVALSNVTGGAQLGSPATAVVSILKSDFPNGRFAFQGAGQISLPNPETPQRQVLLVERTRGVLGQQEVFWRIMGPNNPSLQLEDTGDLSSLSQTGSEVTAGSFTWADGESGTRQLILDIKAYTSWEVEKSFVVELYRVVATPQGIGAGEVDEEMGKVTIKIERFGDPNGVVEFTGDATTERQVLEPDGVSPATLVFQLTRRSGSGVVGNIQVFWEVRPSSVGSSDIQPFEGSVILPEGQRDTQIVLQILPDDIPELTEEFSLVLVRVEGGATLDPGGRESKFSIRYNDEPHGEFGLLADQQAVEVNAADMTRHVRIAVARFGGTFGSVLASYTISYDLGGTGIVVEPSTGTVTFGSGENETLALVALKGDAFLGLGSTFTIRLTEVRFLGSGETSPPGIRTTMSKVQVAVPALAANTELSFSSDLALVNEDDETLTVTLTRAGTYGSLTVDWLSGYAAATKPAGVENGEITPTNGIISMAHGQEEATLTVQVAAQVNRTEAFVLRLPRAPQTVVSGGARLASTNQMIRADPAGLIRFSGASLDAHASELELKVTLTLWRLYGSESRLAVYYETVPQTATKALDFRDVQSDVITMDASQTVAEFDIRIYQDNLPEQAESFYVNLTRVERLPTPTQPVLSPRLSEIKSLSTVTIAESNDAYGILSLTPGQVDVLEDYTTVTLTVVRSAGDFGAVSVTVRTVGGGESWTSQIVPDISNGGRPPDTIAQALGMRTSQGTASGGIDYEILNTAVELQAKETEKRVQVRILKDDTPEPMESVLVYLTQPLGGARIATGMPDGGKKGFAEIRIEANDLSNGIIGFAEDSRQVQVDEDAASPPRAALKLVRLNTFIGDVTVSWKAKMNLTSSDQEDARLSEQLNVTAGSVTCPADQSLCDLFVYLRDDDNPEGSVQFVVLLTGTMPDAQLNQDSLSATVTILPSDDVRGLIRFTQDSKIVIAGENARSVRLSVKRDQGQQHDVGVAFDTQQMSDRVQVSGTTVYPALDGQDFRGQTGTLSFIQNIQDPEHITISLLPLLTSDNPLPKQFSVRLHTATNGARVDPQGDTAIIRIVRDSNVAIWTIISNPGDDPYKDNDAIFDLVYELDRIADGPLSDERLDLIEDVLTNINAEGEQRRLPTSVVTSVRNLYCKLLDENMDDARRGRNSLATAVEQFSYTLLTGRPCAPAGSNSKQLESTECAAIRIASGRWRPEVLAGNTFDLQLQNNIAVPNPLPGQDERTSNGCVDFSLLEYRSQAWFDNGNAEDRLMNSAIIALGLKGRPSASTQNPVIFTIHTPDRRIAAKGAQCKYFDEGSERWVSPSGVCQVTNSLGEDDDFVRCECLHMTHYGVTAETQDDDIIGYVVWFYVICFICMTCLLLAVIVHHLFFTKPTFSASLHTHFLMAVFFSHMCFVIDAFLSEDDILALNTSEDNSECIAMSLFLHYFFLAQFMWIATQAVNLWKIFVLNDEHTDRHYIAFFIIGWGVPVILVAIFYAVTYNIYKYHTDLDVEFIYGDVNNNREICFITNEYVALGGILAPVLICLLVLGLVSMKAYQVSPQWQMYDDVYRGRSNEKELPWLLLIYGILVMACVWLALHMIYGYLWMLVLFCIFDTLLGLLVLVLYAVMRNPLFASTFGPSKASYFVSSDMSVYPDHQLSYYSTAPSIKGSEANLLNDTWENTTDGGRSRMTVRRALPSQAYINPPIAVISPAGTISSDSPDFDDLIFALKMGSGGMRSVTPSDISGGSASESLSMREDDISQLSVVLDHYETKRIDIADTHL